MLEKMFTTKMSADKKKLQSRFSKIRSKNGKLSKVIGGILFGIIIAAIICVGVMIAVNNTKDYRMTDAEFSDYIHRPIGAIMADIDYVDDERLVFHYLDGFFVIDQQNNEIIHRINLSKLNIAGHTQGDCFTVFKVDKDGIRISTKDNVVLVKEIQMPGKKRVLVSEYIKGNNINTNIILG